MERCNCGSTQIQVDAVLIERPFVYPDGTPGTEWIGESLGAINCAGCGREVILGAAKTIALMHHLIERKYQQQVGLT